MSKIAIVMGSNSDMPVMQDAIDILKGFISTKFISTAHLPVFSTPTPAVDQNLLIILCGVAAIIGHVYPIFHGFKGGKGGAAAIGMVFAISWPSISLAILLWMVILIFTGYVGFGTMIGSVSVIYFAYYFKDIKILLLGLFL